LVGMATKYSVKRDPRFPKIASGFICNTCGVETPSKGEMLSHLKHNSRSGEVLPHGQKEASPVEQVQQTTLERFEYERQQAMSSLSKIISTAQRELHNLEQGNWGPTDFVSQHATDYALSLAKMSAISSQIASLNWLANQINPAK
jgi:hypothetical protein